MRLDRTGRNKRFHQRRGEESSDIGKRPLRSNPWLEPDSQNADAFCSPLSRVVVQFIFKNSEVEIGNTAGD